MARLNKKAALILIAAVCVSSLLLTSCFTASIIGGADGPTTVIVGKPGESAEDVTELDTELDTEAETEPELTDELPNEFDEEDIVEVMRDALLYDEKFDILPIFHQENCTIEVTNAARYVNDFRVIAEGFIHGNCEWREFDFKFIAEFERFSHNNRWGISDYMITYIGDAPLGFNIEDAELQLEERLGYPVEVTGYEKNDDGSATIKFDYTNLDIYAPICVKYTDSTAKYVPFANSDAWYIYSYANGAASYSHMEATYGEHSLTDGDVTLNLTLTEEDFTFYKENGYFSLEYTSTYDDTVYEGFGTLSISYLEFNDWDNNDTYINIWHNSVLSTGRKNSCEFGYRAYKNKTELSGWYLDDVKLEEN